MTRKIISYIGLGSNLGDRKALIDKALKMLSQTEDIKLTGISSVIQTKALADAEQPEYLNAVAQIETSLCPEELLERLLFIETVCGRQRKRKWAPRTIDLDLLLFGDEVIEQPDLIVPHSQLHLRSFALSGLCELDSKLVHPVLNETAEALLSRLNGQDFAVDGKRPQLISVAGIIGVGKTTLAAKISEILNCQLILEPYDENPYMKKVYAGQKELALDSQLYFLNKRAEQLNRDRLKPGRIAVSDYIFDKEQIYAHLLLDSAQLASYQQKYRGLAAEVAGPVLVIYLVAPAQRCLERIHNRNRPYEQQIKIELLQRLDGDYNKLFAGWKACPVITVEMSKFDCNCKADLEHLIKQIKSYTTGYEGCKDEKRC